MSEWTAASLDEGGGWRHNFVTIEQLMTTDLVTVAEDDPVELAANLMDWHRIRQVLVEDAGHQLRRTRLVPDHPAAAGPGHRAATDWPTCWSAT